MQHLPELTHRCARVQVRSGQQISTGLDQNVSSAATSAYLQQAMLQASQAHFQRPTLGASGPAYDPQAAAYSTQLQVGPLCHRAVR